MRIVEIRATRTIFPDLVTEIRDWVDRNECPVQMDAERSGIFMIVKYSLSAINLDVSTLRLSERAAAADDAAGTTHPLSGNWAGPNADLPSALGTKQTATAISPSSLFSTCRMSAPPGTAIIKVLWS
jgi:hypothetical protein